MVLPILVAIISAPALLGTQEAIRQSQAKEKREEHRARRCNLIATCVKSSMRSREINGRPVVLRDGKLWIDTGTSDGNPFGHPYAGYYLPYPDTKYEGLVTTITDVAPIMNWVYVDKDTYEVKYGVRLDAQPNFTGPFDCTRQDRRLTFDGWEGWCAVEEFPSVWALYFDKDDDGLRSKVTPGTRVLEIELTRKEKRWKKESEARQQDQTTNRAVDANEEAPVDNPVTSQPGLNPPGAANEPPEPFPIPKSIFTDVPQPSGPEPMLPQPKTPPPAYSKNVPPMAPLPRDTSPQAPGPSTTPPSRTQPTPPSEKRVTPKLNRNSGTRALAQAQMFEAMALGKKPTNEAPYAGTMPPSRPVSNATSASDYSNPPKTGVTDIFQMYLDRPESTILPLATTVKDDSDMPPMPTADPAVFGANVPRDVPKSNTGMSSSPPLRRKPSFRSVPDSQAPKAPLPPLPSSTRTNTRPPRSPERRPSASRSSPVDRRAPAPTARTRNISPDLRRPVASVSRDPPPSSAPRNTPGTRPPLLSRSSPSVRQRNGSTSSSQSQAEDAATRPSPRPLARTNTAPVRKSMAAATMTTGTRNRGMATRLGVGTKEKEEDVEKAERSRTTSGLYREIDELVGAGRGRSGSGSGREGLRKDTGRERERERDVDRPAPLRRAKTGLVDDGRVGSSREIERGVRRRAEGDTFERR